jgi:hypothetical protein
MGSANACAGKVNVFAVCAMKVCAGADIQIGTICAGNTCAGANLGAAGVCVAKVCLGANINAGLDTGPCLGINVPGCPVV